MVLAIVLGAAFLKELVIFILIVGVIWLLCTRVFKFPSEFNYGVILLLFVLYVLRILGVY